MLSRMKYIDRWSLMRNSQSENLSEHSFEVGVTAHALVLLHNSRFGGSLNAERAAVLGLFHDAPESLTGDLPTPVKYHNAQLREAYKTVENGACEVLVSMLPDDMKAEYKPFFFAEESDLSLWKFVKAADKLSALTKCIEERKAGNTEFIGAEKATLEALHNMNMPEVECFLEEFLPAYGMTLDELRGGVI